MPQVPVVVDNQVEIFGQVELILQSLAETLLVNLVQPMAHTDIESVSGLVEENATARYHGVVVLGVEYRRCVALGLGAVVLLLPIGLVQLADGGLSVDKWNLVGINLFDTEQRAVGRVVPKYAELGCTIVHKAPHDVHKVAVFGFAGVIYTVVVFSHNALFSGCKITQKS